MHPHVTAVLSRLDRSRAAVREAVARVPPQVRATRPGPDRWSADEILEHLAIVDARFDAIVGEAIAQARAAGLGPESGELVLLADAMRARIDDRSEKRQAPENMVPSGSLHADAAVAAWDLAHEQFRATVIEADGLALSRVLAEHRRWGSLSVYQWVDVLARHETRHAAQIGDLAAELSSSAHGGGGASS
jgi:hypothetical protein